MVKPDPRPAPPYPPSARAEASAWVARLHGPNRDPAAERGFKAWLAADPAHSLAFDAVTEVWEGLPAVMGSAPRPRQRRLAPVAAALLLTLASGIGAAAWLTRDPVYVTAPGEQKSIVLQDGSRVTLNTGTRLVIDYRRDARRLRLERGEALFQVAKNPQRPFIVDAGAERVRALGTVFMVRRDPAAVAVTLVEGHVSVTGDPRRIAPTVLSPGQRLTLAAATAPSLDRPRLEAVTAWRHGEVVFNDATLGQAVAELNRYGGARLVIRDPRLAGLRVSGVFATNDAEEFASAVAALHGLEVRHEDDAIILDPS